jgi:transposase
MNPELVIMQDGAPGHFAKDTQVDLNERGIYPIFWPAFSPDLNPIETVWDRMKDYIKRHYPEYHSSYNKLRRVVKEA